MKKHTDFSTPVVEEDHQKSQGHYPRKTKTALSTPGNRGGLPEIRIWTYLDRGFLIWTDSIRQLWRGLDGLVQIELSGPGRHSGAPWSRYPTKGQLLAAGSKGSLRLNERSRRPLRRRRRSARANRATWRTSYVHI